MNAALLLVDVQQDFLQTVGLSPEARTLEKSLSELLAHARKKAWRVFHVRTLVAADGSNAMPHWRGLMRCVAGTAGAEPPAALKALPGEPVFEKRFYSPFDDPGLAAGLHAAGVGTVIVAGLYTHACVRSAAVDAYARGFDVIVPIDAVASYDPEHAAITLRWMHGRVARCLLMKDFPSQPDGA